MRISGLASGIDTDEMVKSLMQVEKIKVDKVERDKQTALWRQEAYNSINKDFVNFILNSRKSFGLTSVTSRGSFKPNSYRNLDWLKGATSSNEDIAKVSTSGQAMDGKYKVEVKQVADGVSMASGSETGIVNDEGILLDDDGEIIKELEFTINGKSVNIADEDGIKMNDLIKTINSTEDIGVRVSYDAGIDRFFIQSNSTGADAEINIAVVEGSAGAKFIDGLDLNISQYSEDGVAQDRKVIINDLNDPVAEQVIYKGSDAIINFNGANNIAFQSNRITINGITMDIEDRGEFTVSIATDVDTVYDKIEEFINSYNELVEKTSNLLGQKHHRDYRPLTADEKKAMEKEDIELWEEKAKSGLLRNDDIIERTMLNIRRSLYERSDEFNGPFKLITQIGIATDEYSRASAGGKLVIDSDRLKEAIAEDPEGVMEFLFKESLPERKDEQGNILPGEIGGIVSRIQDNLMNGMEDIIKRSGVGDNEADRYREVKFNILRDFVTKDASLSRLDKDVLGFNKTIEDLNAILFRKENSYYAKFTAMEKAIHKMNQQSMWLAQQTML